MATYLQGVQDLAIECDLGSIPSTTVGLSGEFQRLAKYYKDAWTEIQNTRRWRWMRHEFTLTTTSGIDTYAPSSAVDSTTSATIDRFAEWRLEDRIDPPRIFLNSSGISTQTWLTYAPWEWFKTIYRIGTQQSSAPTHITIDPQYNIVLGPIPNDVYVVTCEYYRSPQTLSLDSDVPEMPTQFHNLIMYEAMKKYAYSEAASELLSIANMQAASYMRDLERLQLPRIRLGRPMA